jgi:hypothetical protein
MNRENRSEERIDIGGQTVRTLEGNLLETQIKTHVSPEPRSKFIISQSSLLLYLFQISQLSLRFILDLLADLTFCQQRTENIGLERGNLPQDDGSHPVGHIQR